MTRAVSEIWLCIERCEGRCFGVDSKRADLPIGSRVDKFPTGVNRQESGAGSFDRDKWCRQRASGAVEGGGEHFLAAGADVDGDIFRHGHGCGGEEQEERSRFNGFHRRDIAQGPGVWKEKSMTDAGWKTVKYFLHGWWILVDDCRMTDQSAATESAT